MKKSFLIALLALLVVLTIVLAATLDLWAGDVNEDQSSFWLSGQNSRMVQAVIGLAVFVILGLFGVIFKGPKR